LLNTDLKTPVNGQQLAKQVDAKQLTARKPIEEAGSEELKKMNDRLSYFSA
jgi:hypothetical protein